MKIYEIIFYGDSPKKIPFICEIKNEAECERFQQGISYNNEEDIEIKIIQQGYRTVIYHEKDIQVVFFMRQLHHFLIGCSEII